MKKKKKYTLTKRRPVENIITPNSPPIQPPSQATRPSPYGSGPLAVQPNYDDPMMLGKKKQENKQEPYFKPEEDKSTPDFRSQFQPTNPITVEQKSLYEGRFVNNKPSQYNDPYFQPQPNPQLNQPISYAVPQQSRNNPAVSDISEKRPPAYNEEVKSQLMSQLAGTFSKPSAPYPNLSSVPPSPDFSASKANIDNSMQELLRQRNEAAMYDKMKNEPIKQVHEPKTPDIGPPIPDQSSIYPQPGMTEQAPGPSVQQQVIQRQVNPSMQHQQPAYPPQPYSNNQSPSFNSVQPIPQQQYNQARVSEPVKLLPRKEGELLGPPAIPAAPTPKVQVTDEVSTKENGVKSNQQQLESSNNISPSKGFVDTHPAQEQIIPPMPKNYEIPNKEIKEKPDPLSKSRYLNELPQRKETLPSPVEMPPPPTFDEPIK